MMDPILKAVGWRCEFQQVFFIYESPKTQTEKREDSHSTLLGIIFTPVFVGLVFLSQPL